MLFDGVLAKEKWGNGNPTDYTHRPNSRQVYHKDNYPIENVQFREKVDFGSSEKVGMTKMLEVFCRKKCWSGKMLELFGRK